MSNKEFIQEQIKKIKSILKDNENVFSKEMKSLYEEDIKHYNQVLKDLDRLYKIEKIYNKSQKSVNDYGADDAICDIGEVIENGK